MALTTSGILTGQPIQAVHITQFYDLFTGAMSDQAIVFANSLTLSKASGTGLTVTASVSIAGGLGIAGGLQVDGGSSLAGVTCQAIDANAGQFRSAVNGAGGGFVAGSGFDVSLYRGAADRWQTADSLQVGANFAANGQVPAAPATYTLSNVGVSRTGDMDTVTVAQLADIFGTLVADLRAIGLLL